VRAYHKEGKSKRWIAESMTLSRRTVDTIINKADGTDRSTVKRRVKLGVPTLPQPKRAQVVIRPGYFSVVVWALVAPLLLAVYLALIGLIKDYTPDRYELSKSRHSSPTQSLAIAPPSTLDTTSEAALAAQPKAQSAPEIPAKVEPTAQAEPEIPAKVEPTAEAALEIPAKVEPAAEAAPEIPAKVEPAAEAAPEIPAKVEPTAEAAPEIPAKVEPTAEAAPEIPAKVEPICSCAESPGAIQKEAKPTAASSSVDRPTVVARCRLVHKIHLLRPR
jgi:hypothetical protein